MNICDGGHKLWENILLFKLFTVLSQWMTDHEFALVIGKSTSDTYHF